jgi:hypothetical protein
MADGDATMNEATMATGMVPVPQADLRPGADAAATCRDAVPEMAVASPPIRLISVTVRADVGRNLPAAETMAAEGGKGEGERRLKPWEVEMLPRTAKGDGSAADRVALTERALAETAQALEEPRA